MSTKKVLIVDDEPDICELIEITLMRMGLSSSSALNLKQAKKLLAQENFDLCLSDMRLPDGNGIELVEYIQQTKPNLPIAVITAHGNMESAVKALKAGAFDFVSKPVDISILRNLVAAATALPDNKKTKKQKNQLTITGKSPQVKQLLKNIEKLARNQAPVFIHGESGSGKERVARMIHQQGARSGAPFVPVNCGAIPPDLIESEFFGHLKGSFTGAHNDREGLFQAANGGTLFLDEIAELPLNTQVKLLRVIQEKAVRSVGGEKEILVDVRILSASHKNLEQLVAEGKFREDLFYRINVIELHIPSLRERKQDIPLFVTQILNALAKKMNISVPIIENEAIQALINHSFAGNVRELENILERAIALLDDNIIKLSDLQLKTNITSQAELVQNKTTQQSKQKQPLDLAEQERLSIIKTLEQTRWNKTSAAKVLGLSLRQLRYRLQKYDIK